MAEAFIDKFRRFCGGSKELACLAGLNIAVSIVVWITGFILTLSHIDSTSLHTWLALPSSPALFVFRPWTLLTYMFTQFSPLHLLFNILWLYWFGRMMIFSTTGRRLIICYLGGGAAGGLAYLTASACGMAAGAYLCGASSSVLAIMCTVAITMPDYELNLFLFGRVKMKWLAAVCAVLTLIGASATEAGTIAHAGGILFGVIYGCIRKGMFKKYEDSFKAKKAGIKKSFRSNPTKDAGAAVKAMQGRLSDHERLDQLLDKIRISGYASLSEAERLELDALSRRIR